MVDGARRNTTAKAASASAAPCAKTTSRQIKRAA
jgi:hypothetical protein